MHLKQNQWILELGINSHFNPIHIIYQCVEEESYDEVDLGAGGDHQTVVDGKPSDYCQQEEEAFVSHSKAVFVPKFECLTCSLQIYQPYFDIMFLLFQC